MKCPYCGGEIGLEDKFCSWCGRPNEQAVHHREDMERFQQAFRETESAVAGKTKHYVRTLPQLIVILVLLIVTVVSVVIGSQAWEFNDAVRRGAAERNPAKTRAALDAFLEQRDYRGFYTYAEFHCLRFYDGPFEDYGDIYYCVSSYARLLRNLEDVYLHRDREAWLKSSAENDIRYLSDAISGFFDELRFLARRDLTARDQACVQDMHATAEGMLRVFLGLEGDELTEFLSLSQNRQAVLLEEVLLGE